MLCITTRKRNSKEKILKDTKIYHPKQFQYMLFTNKIAPFIQKHLELVRK